MKIGVFCSARSDFSESLLNACRDFSLWMGEQGHTLVYGGARVGLMGLVADAVLKGGGQVEGYMPRSLFSEEVPHRQIQKMVEVADLFERKRLMMESAEAFVILPGGLGTLDEFFEVLTWRSLECLNKPIYVFNYEGFWDSLEIMMKDLQTKKVLQENIFSCYTTVSSLAELKEALC